MKKTYYIYDTTVHDAIRDASAWELLHHADTQLLDIVLATNVRQALLAYNRSVGRMRNDQYGVRVVYMGAKGDCAGCGTHAELHRVGMCGYCGSCFDAIAATAPASGVSTFPRLPGGGVPLSLN